jgi:CheY-like chemotaxis protein
MLEARKNIRVIIADATPSVLRLLSEVLRGAGVERIHFARNGRDLLNFVTEFSPDIVITTSRLPEFSGLEFTRLIRGGYKNVPRDLPVIVMTNSATKAFLEAARTSGVDEILVRPFTGEAVIERMLAVLKHKRDFVDSVEYIGPCRRRRARDEYNGPMRRFMDPTDDMPGAPLWESEGHRQAVRKCVQRISEHVSGLTPGDRKKLREIYNAVKETHSMADESRDEALAAATRSLGRYIMAVGAGGILDEETVRTHIDAMHTLSVLTSAEYDERQKLVEGLSRIVDKKLGRSVDVAGANLMLR